MKLIDQPALQIHDETGATLVRIEKSGKVIISEGVEVDEAARIFWDAVERIGGLRRYTEATDASQA